jgi:5-methylcytosine-specific restriction endonuclease McrA
MKRKAKKRPKPRAGLERPYNGGKWTEAKMRGFAMSALRRAAWPPKHEVIKRAFVEKGINPKTGKPCMLHRCEECHNLFPKGDMKADHKEPVIPIVHDWQQRIGSFLGYDFNEVMRRLWIEEGEGWNVLCEQCHSKKTMLEKSERAHAGPCPRRA